MGNTSARYVRFLSIEGIGLIVILPDCFLDPEAAAFIALQHTKAVLVVNRLEGMPKQLSWRSVRWGTL